MQDELETILTNWAKKEGCDLQAALRDLLTDCWHIAKNKGLDIDAAIEGSAEVFCEERG